MASSAYVFKHALLEAALYNALVKSKRQQFHRRIGEVLETYTVSHQVDVLVMGAYGHAKWREFILGGATKSLLSKPPLPILFSH